MIFHIENSAIFFVVFVEFIYFEAINCDKIFKNLFFLFPSKTTLNNLLQKKKED
jgi:hypothetical protein